MNPAPAQRLPAIDELKGLGLILVVYYHITGVSGGPNAFHAEVGVDLFLLVSGFTLTLTSGARTTAEFFHRRVLRILPAYWFAILLFVLLDRFVRGVGHSWHSIALHLSGLSAFGPEYDFWDINMSFWFIALLLPLYVVFGLLRHRFKDPWTVLGGGLLAGALASVIYDAVGMHGLVEHLTVRIPSFFAGVSAGLIRREGHLRPGPNVWFALGTLACLYLAVEYGDRFFYVPESILLTLCYLGVRRFLPRLLQGTLALIGLYSYEIYLFHQPLIRDYNRLAWARLFHVADPSRPQLREGVAAGLIAATILAVLFRTSWQALERGWRRQGTS